jgi:hypothetical protein
MKKTLYSITFCLFFVSFSGCSKQTPPSVDEPNGVVSELTFDELLAKAEGGDAIAQSKLGSRYYKGKGVKQDYTQALKWYQKAAEQGDVYGQVNLGFFYCEGLGVEQNYDKAIE